MTFKQNTRQSQSVWALVANARGEIFELEGYAALGMTGRHLMPLTLENTLPMPFGGELMYLPGRIPVVYNTYQRTVEALYENPFEPGEPLYPVAAFNSPGYVNAYVCAYEEEEHAVELPLFSYGAVGWSEGEFRTPLIQVDDEPRQDLRQMPHDGIVAGTRRLQSLMPRNRLRRHIEHCALSYGCPAAKNFFLGRYEAPLPTSRQCNAGCLGCISQQKGAIKSPQDRIDFTPTPEEIAEIAIFHIKRVKQAVVSFGQGCEGDPLLAAHVILPAIKRIRAETMQGTINMNTNGSLPDTVRQLFDNGLDSIRISMNSVRKGLYDAYFNPKGYTYADVLKSIDTGIAANKFVSINYLNCPGVTDTPEEISALHDFLTAHPVHMIQWRNLNFDPLRYWENLTVNKDQAAGVGMQTMLTQIKADFPDVRFGYFNPPKESWRK